MVSDSYEHLRLASRRLRWILAVVLGAVLAAAWVASAVARPDHSKPTPNASNGNGAGEAPVGGPTEQRRDGGRTQTPVGHRNGSAPPEAASGASHESRDRGRHEQQGGAGNESDQGNRERHDRAGGRERHDSGTQQQGAEPQAQVAPANDQQGDGGKHQQRSGGESQRHKSHGQSDRHKQEQQSRAEERQGSQAQPQGSHEQLGGAREPQSQPHDRKRLEQGVAHSSHTDPPTLAAGTAQAPTTAPAAAPPSPPASAPASMLATAPTAAPSSLPSTVAPPAVTRAVAQPTGHPRRPRARSARAAIAATRFGPVSVVGGASANAPAGARPTVRQHAAGHTRSVAGRPSPIVTTITKIVGVVPTALWVLVGALLALALAAGVRSRLVALRARRLERQRGELLEDVGLLQAALLPLPPARLGPVGTSVAYRPADGPGAGGDFYDLFALEDGQIAVILGDISGHGRQALPHTALVRFTLRAYLEAGLSPRGAVQTAGAVLERQLGESFATVVVATYHPRDRVLLYACAGHPPPIVRGEQSIAPITICSAPPIGAGMRTGTRQCVVEVPGWSQLCLHTDGVTEARVGGELYGEERLAATLAALGPKDTASTLLERVADDTSARPDDMAACLLWVEGGRAAPRVLVEELEVDRHEVASERTAQFLLACGVERHELAELVRSAQAVAGSTGTVLMELRLSDGPPQVALRRDNVALLHKRRLQQQAQGRASR